VAAATVVVSVVGVGEVAVLLLPQPADQKTAAQSAASVHAVRAVGIDTIDHIVAYARAKGL
jgi:hypothetical protein